MSSTNKTTNYDLSQFIGVDKPAWLQDYNSDMSKIDAQMKANADSATAASGTASATSTNLGDISALETTVKTSAVNAINEVNTKATAAQNTATSANTTAQNALTTASAASTNISGLQSYLNLQSSTTGLTVTTTSGTVDGPGTLIKSAHNSDGSLGKIYGKTIITAPRSSSTVITFGDTGLRPTEAINILGLVTIAVYATIEGGTSLNYVATAPITINPNGTASITMAGGSIIDHADIFLPPCLLFMSNFGD